MHVTTKVKNGGAASDVKSLLKVPKVSFDRFTEQANASLAKVLWSSKVTEGRAGSVVVSKIKECLHIKVLKVWRFHLTLVMSKSLLISFSIHWGRWLHQ